MSYCSDSKITIIAACWCRYKLNSCLVVYMGYANSIHMLCIACVLNMLLFSYTDVHVD